MKDTLILRTDIRETVNTLTDEEAGKLFKVILAYQAGELEEIDDRTVQIAFTPIKQNLDFYNMKWEKTCEARREAGKKGGRPKKANAFSEKQTKAKKANAFFEKQTKAKKAEYEYEYDYEYVNDKDIKESKHAHGQFQNVKLTQEEYERLVQDFGQEKTNEAIEFLSAYMKEKPYKTKSHYLTLRRWVFNAIDERKDRPSTPQNAKIHNFEERRYDASAFERLVSN